MAELLEYCQFLTWKVVSNLKKETQQLLDMLVSLPDCHSRAHTFISLSCCRFTQVVCRRASCDYQKTEHTKEHFRPLVGVSSSLLLQHILKEICDHVIKFQSSPVSSSSQACMCWSAREPLPDRLAKIRASTCGSECPMHFSYMGRGF